MAGLEQLSELRDRHRPCLRWTFFVSNILMVAAAIAMMVTGVWFTHLDVFQVSNTSLDWMQSDVTIGIIVFTLILVALIVAGFYMVARETSNCKVAIYGVALFCFAFIPLLGQGGALLALDELDEEAFVRGCLAARSASTAAELEE